MWNFDKLDYNKEKEGRKEVIGNVVSKIVYIGNKSMVYCFRVKSSNELGKLKIIILKCQIFINGNCVNSRFIK